MKDKKDITYLMHESDMARAERSNRRLWILCIILIFLCLITNGLWTLYETRYDNYETSIEAQQDGDGINIIGGGDIDYGAESKN